MLGKKYSGFLKKIFEYFLSCISISNQGKLFLHKFIFRACEKFAGPIFVTLYQGTTAAAFMKILTQCEPQAMLGLSELNQRANTLKKVTQQHLLYQTVGFSQSS